MKIASWNVNSLRVRLPQVLDWLAAARPDLLALQETKVPDEEFPLLEIRAAGYHAVYSGQKGYNGVAILSREPPQGEPATALPGIGDGESRVLCADYGGVRLVNVYAPNGREVGSEAYARKLRWFAQLAAFLQAELQRHPQLVLVGDLNVAPDARDVYKPLLWENQILYSAAERAAFQALLRAGMVDVVRVMNGEARLYSWWDYRFRAFEADRGLRIDHVLASPALGARCVAATVDRAPRGKARPSDHAPVVAEFSAR
jgi:exodeoxyribonuclease-3